MSLRRKPTRVGDAVYVGAVWTNGEPILVADAADAEAWRGSQRLDDVLASLEGRDTAPIDGAGYALGLELDEGTLDVFRLDDGRVLMIGLLHGGGDDDRPAFVASALAAERKPVGALDIRTGHVAVLSSAADWPNVGKVAAEPRAAPKRRQPADNALLLECAAGSHDLGYAYVEHSDVALQAWLLSSP
jgi:hypothetical protein